MKNKAEIKEKVMFEATKYLLLTLFLMLFLISLTIFRNIILGKNIFIWMQFSYDFLESLILAKIILLGRMLKLGERFGNKSLAIPVVYKAFIFSLFVLVFSFLEHFIMGYIHRKNLTTIWQELTTQNLNQVTGKTLIMFLIFILLFSFFEISRFFGEKKVYRLFFRRSKVDE